MVSRERSGPSGSGPGVRPVSPNPYRFRTARVPLIVEGIVLAVLGVWGLAVSLGGPSTPVGSPVAWVFHLTAPQSGLLLATGLAAVASAHGRTLARVVAGVQASVYLVLFAIGAVAVARARPGWWGFDDADVALAAALMALGLALTMWLAGSALEGRWWVERPGPHGPRSG